MEKALVSISQGDVDVQRRIRTIRGVQVMIDRDLCSTFAPVDIPEKLTKLQMS